MIKRGHLSCLFKDKRGEGLVFPVVIFIVLNLMFFSLLMFFVFKSSTGALVYEQAYAKEIALMIDSAKPVTIFSIDFTKGLEIAENNRLSSESMKDLVDFKDNKVIVKLEDKGGYAFEYFSNYEISSYFNGNFLIITVNAKIIENEI